MTLCSRPLTLWPKPVEIVRLASPDRIEPPWIFRRENQLRLFLFWEEKGNGDGEAAQVVYA